MDQNKVARDCKGNKDVRNTADLRNNKNAKRTANSRRNRRRLSPRPQGPQGNNKKREF